MKHDYLTQCAYQAGVNLTHIHQGKKSIRCEVEKNGKRGLVFVSISPSDWRAQRNIIRDMKRVTA
jgi:hypothetical protein